MTEQLPTPIEPQDILPGMKVEARNTSWGVVKTFTFTADYTHDGKIYAKDSGPHGASFAIALFDWFLISRPTPPREPGTLWRHRLTDARFVWSSRGFWMQYEFPENGAVTSLHLYPGSPSAYYIVPVEPPEVAEVRRELADKISRRADSHSQTPGYLAGYIGGLREAARMVQP